MAKKDDFTEQEFEALQKGVTGTGLFVAVSDRGFFDTFKESAALAKHVAAAKQGSSSELVREIADVHGSGFSVRSKPEELETETLAALQTAKTTLEAKAPDELEAYRQFVLEVAQSVADAAGGGETAESGAIEKVKSALQ
jgi:spermidine synthase